MLINFLAKIIFIIFLLFSCSCQPSEGAINTAIAQTQSAQPSPSLTNTSPPNSTNTPRPSPSPIPPTDIPTPTEPISVDQLWSKNYVGSADSGGLIIEIGRVLVGYKTALPEFDWDGLNDIISGWPNIQVVGELIFKITNNSSTNVTMYPDQGSIQIGNEQIELRDSSTYTSFGDDLGGEIYPGITKIGGMWFGIKRSTPDQISQLIYRCDAPYDTSSYNDLGPDIEIVVEIPLHTWEEWPDELK